MEKELKLEYYREKMRKETPFVIEYPICGGAAECISACPLGEKIWSMEIMEVSLFGMKKRQRFRPVMTNPALCKRCDICVQACPTGALHLKEKTVKSRFFTVLVNTLKLPFKGKYNLKFILSDEHIRAFKRNNAKKT